MRYTSLRSRLLAGEVLIGSFQIIDSPLVAEIMGEAGSDFVIIDQEHGPLGAREAMRYCMAVQDTRCAPVVRVRDNRMAEIQRALDIGAGGVEIPQINTVEDARGAARASRFDPEGERGLHPYVRASGYAGDAGYTDRANEDTCVIIHVEGTEAIDNLDEILRIDGIDVIFLGPYDLSQSLGIPGDVTHERVEVKMRSVCDRAIDAGKIVGTYADDAAMASQWIDAGVQYVAVSVDSRILFEAYHELFHRLGKEA